MRKIVNICFVFALMTGYWGGVLAAVVCPHAGCQTNASAPDTPATQDDHADSHCHNAADSEDASSRDQEHEGHAAKLPIGDQFERGKLLGGGSSSGDGFCTHCVDGRETPPSPVFAQQSNSVKRGMDFAAPLAAAHVESPAPVFLRKIKPAQHAPPGQSGRHLLLLNVFRI